MASGGRGYTVAGEPNPPIHHDLGAPAISLFT